jgi:hypothetical protein
MVRVAEQRISRIMLDHPIPSSYRISGHKNRQKANEKRTLVLNRFHDNYDGQTGENPWDSIGNGSSGEQHKATKVTKWASSVRCREAATASSHLLSSLPHGDPFFL